jgi:hypothetical protein
MQVIYIFASELTLATFERAFQNMARHVRRQQIENHSPCSATLTALFTDRDLAMAAAAKVVWPNVFHGICLWHLAENISKRLGSMTNFAQFTLDFWLVYKAPSPKSFLSAWERLVSKYPAGAAYLMEEVYPDRERWAWAWVGSRFTAGIRTTGRVEGQHRIYKLKGAGRNTTISELFDLLNNQASAQERKAIQSFQQVV